MAKLVKRKVVEETYEVPVEDDLDRADEVMNEDDEIVDGYDDEIKAALGGAKRTARPRSR